MIGANREKNHQLTRRDGGGRSVHRWPQWLPDGRHVLFMASKDRNKVASFNAEVVNVETMERKIVLPDCLYARYAKSGHLLFIKDGSLYASAFDLGALEVKGEHQLLRSEVAVTSGEAAQYTLSEEGTLVYLTGPDQSGENMRKLLWLDLQGVKEPTVASQARGGFTGMALSPDDRIVALARDGRIYSLDLSVPNAEATPITPVGETNSRPLWVPGTGNRSFVYQSTRDGKEGVWLKGGPFVQPVLLFPEVDESVYPYSISPDGKSLFGSTYVRDGPPANIWVRAMEDTNEAPRILLTGEQIAGPALSHDGSWLVYSKDFQLFLSPYGRAGGEMQLTSEGGMRPRWSRNANRIYYAKWDSLWSFDLSLQGGVPEKGQHRKLLDWPQNRPRVFADFWDIDSTEKRVLVLVNETDVSLGSPESSGANAVNIVFNFFTELNEKLPPGKK